MKSMQLPKVFQWLPVLIIMTMLVACSTGTKAEQSSTNAKETSATSPTTNEQKQTENEPVKLTVMPIVSSFPALGVQNDPVANEIQKATGISLNVIYQNASHDQWKSKLTALAASGDLPDLIQLNASDLDSIKLRDMLIKSGQVIELSDLINTHGQNLLANPKIKFAVDYRKEFYNPGDKKLWVIPSVIGAQSKYGTPVVASYVPWGYYKELGFPAVNNRDDLLNVLEQMQKNHPTATNGKKAYGISFHVDWGMEPIYENMMLEGYYIAQLLQIDITNNEVSDFYRDQQGQFWHWEKWFFDAKQRGILDPDSLTQTYDQLQQKIAADATYFYTLASAASTRYAPLDYRPGKAIDANYGVAGGSDVWLISKNSKYPERAMQLFNFLASDEGTFLAYNGIEGQAWDTVNGKPQLKQEVQDELKKQGLENKSKEKYGLGIYTRMVPLVSTEDNAKYNTTNSLNDSIDAVISRMKDTEKDAAKHYGVDTLGQVFLKREVNGYLNPIGNALQSPTGDIKEKFDKINAYIGSNWLKPITAKNDAEFTAIMEKIVKDLNNMGYDEVYNWYKDQWYKTKASVELFGLK